VAERPASAARSWRRLEDLSPVVRSLAREQFDDLVKRVRIFAEPATASAVAGCKDLERLVLDAAEA
jgi:threonine synthase